MFAAVFRDKLQRLAKEFLRENYLFVFVGDSKIKGGSGWTGGANMDIKQEIIECGGKQMKMEKLVEICQDEMQRSSFSFNL